MLYYSNEHNLYFNLEPDNDYVESPRENGYDSTFITFERDYSSPDENPFKEWDDMLKHFGVKFDEYGKRDMYADLEQLQENALKKGYIAMPVWKYGVSSFFASNLINNIPMSVFQSAILSQAPTQMSAVYATVVGSNLGACLTPIGALAGIMWSTILRGQNLKFTYLDFLKIGVTVAIPALLASLGVLTLIF